MCVFSKEALAALNEREFASDWSACAFRLLEEAAACMSVDCSVLDPG